MARARRETASRRGVPAPAPRGRRAGWWRWPLLALIVAAPYAATIRAGFVNWDDPSHVYENPRVLRPDGILLSFHDASEPGLYPALMTTYWVEWRASGGEPWLFHLDNIALHAANAVLVGVLAGELGMPAGAAWLVGAVWALHPAHVESVAWVTERKNVLYVFFWLVSLLLWMRRPARFAYAASLVTFVLALGSKGAAMTLPAAIVLVESFRRRPLDARFWRALAPYVALGIAGGVGLVVNVPAGVAGPPLARRVPLACRAFWAYLRMFVWPHPLVPVYPRWPLAPVGLPGWLSIAGVVALAIAAGLAWRRLPRLVVLGAGLFATNVFLVLGLVWNSYHPASFVADRYLYLPGVGLALAAVAALGRLGRPATVALAAWGVALGVATWRQVPVWHDSGTFWTHALAHNRTCALCEYDLANALRKDGHVDEAVPHYRAALALVAPDVQPTPVDVHNNLGVALLQAGRVDEARTEFEETVRLRPGDRDAEFNLGLIASHAEDWDAAIGHYRNALAGDGEPARVGRVHVELATALAERGDADEAVAHWESAHRLLPADAGVLEDLVSALVAHGRTGDAVAALEDGVRRSPDSARLASALAWLRATSADARWRDGAEAVRLAERARGLTREADADLLDILAASYAEAGRFDDAVRTAREALAATDDDADLATEIRGRIAGYEAGRAYRTP